LEDLFARVINDKPWEWLFSGVGIVVVAWVARLIFKKSNASPNNTIHSGKNSTNVIAGGNVDMSPKKKK
jgi:hypothetical protein